MNHDIKIHRLRFIYILGIVIAFFIGILGIPYLNFSKVWFSSFQNLLWPVSIFHMVILVFLGYTYFAPISTIAGAKIQTAGYIHTLIGITAALFKLNPESFTLSAFLYPLGSALTTSIIGWFLGGEIAERGKPSSSNNFKDQLNKVSIEFHDFTSAIRKVHEEYIQTINETNAKFLEIQEKQNDLIKNLELLSQKFNTHNFNMIETALNKFQNVIDTTLNKIEKSIDKSFTKNIEDYIQSIQKFLNRIEHLYNEMTNAGFAMENVAEAANDIAKYLQQSKLLVNELENLIDYISSLKTKK